MPAPFVNQIKGPLRGKFEYLNIIPVDTFRLTGKVGTGQLIGTSGDEVTIRRIINTSVTAGTVTVVLLLGNTVTLPIKAEGYLEGLFNEVTSVTGFGASDLVGNV